MFLAGLNREDVMSLISYMKDHDIKRPIFSMITPTNIDWILGDLIEDVYEEHLMMTQGGSPVNSNFSSVENFVVLEDEGMRLDQFISCNLTTVSRSYIQKLIDEEFL